MCRRHAALVRVFEAFDTDGSGEIGTEELQMLRRHESHDVGSWTSGRLLACVVKRRADRCACRNAKMIEKLDADGSGEVDCEEFVSYFDKVLMRLAAE